MKKVSSGILPIIVVDRQAPKPLYWQVYEAYRASIVVLTRKPATGLRLGLAFAVTDATGDDKQEWFFWPPTAEFERPDTGESWLLHSKRALVHLRFNQTR